MNVFKNVKIHWIKFYVSFDIIWFSIKTYLTLSPCWLSKELPISVFPPVIRGDWIEISEMWWPIPGYFWIGDYRIKHVGISEKNPGISGVRIVMNKNLWQKVKGYMQYGDQIILIQIETKPQDTILYSKSIIKIGDWNAVICEAKVNNIASVYELEQINEREDRLIEFCAQ